LVDHRFTVLTPIHPFVNLIAIAKHETRGLAFRHRGLVLSIVADTSAKIRLSADGIEATETFVSETDFPLGSRLPSRITWSI
jgi:hypothetical protein